MLLVNIKIENIYYDHRLPFMMNTYKTAGNPDCISNLYCRKHYKETKLIRTHLISEKIIAIKIHMHISITNLHIILDRVSVNQEVVFWFKFIYLFLH